MAGRSMKLGALALAASTGCYDWSLRDFTVGDAATDAPAEGGPAPKDAAPPEEAGLDAGSDAASCTDLAKALAAAEDKARTCVLAVGHCQTTVKDGCDCPRFVAQGGSADANAYRNAALAFRAAGCATSCAPCGTLPTTGLCVQSPTPRCSP